METKTKYGDFTITHLDDFKSSLNGGSYYVLMNDNRYLMSDGTSRETCNLCWYLREGDARRAIDRFYDKPYPAIKSKTTNEIQYRGLTISQLLDWQSPHNGGSYFVRLDGRTYLLPSGVPHYDCTEGWYVTKEQAMESIDCYLDGLPPIKCYDHTVEITLKVGTKLIINITE